MASNPYLTSAKAADAVPAVLHPLVLLSISDHITRHTLRKSSGPVVGAILGQQNGRQITLEHTFDFCVDKTTTTTTTPEGGDVRFDAAWFGDRLEQMRTVHKDRSLDLVGWYTILGRGGPTPAVMQVHEQILHACSTGSANSAASAAVLLAFHAEDLQLPPSVGGGKLPITLYETTVKQEDEVAATAATAGPDAVMEDASTTQTSYKSPAEAAAAAAARSFPFTLSELAYTVDSGEAEMISVDFVAHGAANASTASATAAAAAAAMSSSAAAGLSSTDAGVGGGSVSPSSSRDRAVAVESANPSKKRLVSAGPDDSKDNSNNDAAAAATSTATAAAGLTPDEEELIATLTTRANAIRMLHARLQLLTKYVESLPADALAENTAASPAVPAETTDTDAAVSLPILRSIQALVQRLPLVVPPAPAGVFEEERQREANDVEVLSMLLDDMMGGIVSVQGLHKKFTAMESYRRYSARQTQQSLKQRAMAARDGGVDGGHSLLHGLAKSGMYDD